MAEQAELFAGGGARALPVLERRGDALFYALDGARLAAPGTGVMRGTLTVNPYVGCEFSCAYCYAPYAHGWLMERLGETGRLLRDPGTPTAFDRAIFVKRAGQSVAGAVRRAPGALIALGTATDPYQPAERRFGITRGVLETLAGMRGVRVSITTKSPLVLRDLDLLERIRARGGRVDVHVSLISTDARLLRAIEPRSPTPARRLDALRRLRERGIRAGLFAMPLLPGLTDTQESIDALFAAARQADACYVVAGGVRLSELSWRRFLPALRALRPDLVDAYEEIIRRRSPRRTMYRKKLDARIEQARARFGFNRGAFPSMKPDAVEAPQLVLFEGGAGG
ncbi:MAG TPA: radical SAM protein [Longimicrobium sp.]|jgi:DNA repair photolyase